MVVQCLCSGTRFYRDSPVRFETMNEHGSKGHDQRIAKNWSVSKVECEKEYLGPPTEAWTNDQYGADEITTFPYTLPLLNNLKAIQDTFLLMIGAHPNTDTSRTNSGGSQLVSKDRQIHRINVNSLPKATQGNQKHRNRRHLDMLCQTETCPDAPLSPAPRTSSAISTMERNDTTLRTLHTYPIAC
ncbi:hypothetical protein HYE67_000395 [Fusarium culmorum]|uniref:Uncharacterized protein n=1 Tax=Fusarium culmorum TaxID=5516 RepID=A0A7S8HRS7_FUSCU|nr:hypothetical protein HYE67_000395 [Fusarium culmorum]